VRAVHLGLGQFFRAHQAWYTQHASDGADWGIAAFCGRGAQAAVRLNDQDCAYTLNIRQPDGDSYEVIESISSAYANADQAAWIRTWSDPRVVIATLTITEAGYCRSADGSLADADVRIRRDVDALRQGRLDATATAPGQVLAGLIARRDTEAGSITLVPCDNLPGNGDALASVLRQLADRVEAGLGDRIMDGVCVASTVVDRITPAVADADLDRAARALGRPEAALVVTEPFTEWVLSGDFPAGRPAWQAAGARFVTDVTPFGARKLALLNGAHSLMAYAAPRLGCRTVSASIGSDVVRGWVEQYWDEACRHLDLPGAELLTYRAHLLERFANPAIEHRLAQIAADGSVKLPVRILPTLRAERAAGRMPIGAARALAGWTVHLRHGTERSDPRLGEFSSMAEDELTRAVPAVLAGLDPPLAEDPDLVGVVVDLAAELSWP